MKSKHAQQQQNQKIKCIVLVLFQLLGPLQILQTPLRFIDNKIHIIEEEENTELNIEKKNGMFANEL